MVSTCLLISKSSSHFINSLNIVPGVLIAIGIPVTFMFYGFLVLIQDLGIYPSFRFLLILFCGPPGQQSSQFGRFSFVVDYFKVWSSGRKLVIRFYLKIPEEFACLIFLDEF